jgi:signal transduction histidine kinase
MKRGSFFLALAGGLAIVVISFTGFANLRFRPRVALPKSETGPAPRVLRIDDREIRRSGEIDFILSRKKIGDTVAVELDKDGRREAVRTSLVPYYSRTNFPLIFGLTGGFGFLIGFLVFALRPGDRRARLFFAMTLAFASSVVVSGDLYGVHDLGWSLLPGVVFNFAYPFAPALLLAFASTFSPRRPKTWSGVLMAVPFVIGAFLNWSFLDSQLRPSVSAFRAGLAGFAFFRWYVAGLCGLAAAVLIHALRGTSSREGRAQIKWVLTGVCGGLFLYVVFYQIPMAATGKAWLSEDLTSAFFLLMPLAMAVAVLKFRLMDIDVVISRSIVYSIMTVATVGVYLVCVEVLGRFLARLTSGGQTWISLAGVVLAAAAFEPARKKLQGAVDKTFFRQAHDYRKAVLSFGARTLDAPGPDALVSLFTEAVQSVLPMEKIGFFARDPGPPDAPGFEVILPLPLGPGRSGGFVALGRKKSGARYTEDDLDLVSALGAELASGLGRIRLQADVAYEKASREKAEELVRLKTEFVSSVSHELRNPMTSIRNLAELLMSGRIGDASKRGRLLELLAGECGRLSRFVANVLDFGKIERNAKAYDLRSVPVQPVIENVLEFVRSDRGPAGLEVTTEMPADPVAVEADPDALRQAIGNLVDNAVTYGGERGKVTVRVLDGDAAVEIQVEDHGIGIEPGDREKLFDAFYRSPGGVEANPKGTGLGLKIVKHVMDAHGGRILVRSEPGRGSIFSLIFPKRRTS